MSSLLSRVGMMGNGMAHPRVEIVIVRRAGIGMTPMGVIRAVESVFR